MAEPKSLWPAFLAAAPAALRTMPAGELEARLGELWTQARAAWPEVEIDAGRFAAHLGARLADWDDPLAAIGQVRAADLYLALGCALADPAALEAFDTRAMGRVPAWVRRRGDSAQLGAEVAQTLRERLLVGAGGRPPRIAAYAGRGSLEAWLKVAAVRAAVDLRAKSWSEIPGDGDIAEDALGTTSDPELRYIKARYRGDFTAAFREAVAGLSRDERSVLRYNLVDRLNIAEIGSLYGVHRSTVARWIAACREKIVRETRRRLRERLRIDERELESLLGLLRSQLEVSLQSLLLARSPV